MTQALNRLISVTGESTQTKQVPTRFYYHDHEPTFLIAQRGEWNVFQATAQAAADRDFSGVEQIDGDILTSAVLAADLDGLAGIIVDEHYYLGGEPDVGTILPFPTTLQDERGPFDFRVYGPTDDDYLEGVVNVVTRSQLRDTRTRQISATRYILWIDDAVSAEGNLFDIGSLIVFSLSTVGLQEPISGATKDVWARLTDRGADLGLVVNQDEGSSEGAQERITALVRYDPDISVGVEFTDDLGRRWFVLSTATVGDRRYLSYEGVRTFGGLDLPEFGAGL